MKKIICSVIALLMVLAIVPMSAFALYGYTDIRTEEQLRQIEADLGGKYRLVRDINLSGDWTPIGSLEKPFSGLLDGNGYTISGLSVSNSKKGASGLFACVSGQLLDLEVEGVVSGADCVGGLTGILIGGKITNCAFSGVVVGDNYVGGIVGDVRNTTGSTTISGCTNLASVYGNNCVGGIAGVVYALGGSKVSIESCASIENVKANAGVAGGIVGAASVNDCDLSILRTYNSAIVDATAIAGGIIGSLVMGKASSKVDISYGYNSESVTSGATAGAIIGKVATSDGDTVSTTSIVLNEVYNVGTIKGDRNALVLTATRELANKVTLSKVYNTDSSNESIGNYEYEGRIVSRNTLTSAYNVISTLNFNSYIWIAYGNSSYKFVQLASNRAIVKITEKPVIEGELTVGSRLVAKSPYSSSNLTYIWYRNGVAIKGETSQYYDVKSTDGGAMITVRIVADRKYGVVGNAISKAVTITKAAARPFPPVAEYINGDSVTLKAVRGCEYSMDGRVWQADNVFTGLEVGKTYNFYQRVRATSDTSASLPSDPTEITTDKKNIARGTVIEVNIDGKYYEDYCFCDSKLTLYTLLSLHDYEIVWYADGEEIANSEGCATITMFDGIVGKNVVAVVKGINGFTGACVTDPIVPEHYSAYVYDVVAPTCTEWGYSINYCRRCGSTFFDRYTEPTGHKFDEWFDVKAPTCTEDGIQRRVCKCGEAETREVYARGHNFVFEMKKANCGEEGYSRQRCVICDYCVYYDKFPASSRHDYVTTNVAATCTEEGGVLHTCKNCDHSYMTNTIPAKGHIWGSWTTVKAATATEKGIEKRVCTVCKTEETRETAATGNPNTPDIPIGDDISITNIDGKDYFLGLNEKTPVDFLGGSDVKVYDKSNKLKTTGVIATGDRIVIVNDDGSAFVDAIAVVKGDVDGDGKVSSTDYIKIRLAVLKRVELTGANLYAGIVSGGSKITAKDYTTVRIYLMGKGSL